MKYGVHVMGIKQLCMALVYFVKCTYIATQELANAFYCIFVSIASYIWSLLCSLRLQRGVLQNPYLVPLNHYMHIILQKVQLQLWLAIHHQLSTYNSTLVHAYNKDTISQLHSQRQLSCFSMVHCHKELHSLEELLEMYFHTLKLWRDHLLQLQCKLDCLKHSHSVLAPLQMQQYSLDYQKHQLKMM